MVILVLSDQIVRDDSKKVGLVNGDLIGSLVVNHVLEDLLRKMAVLIQEGDD